MLLVIVVFLVAALEEGGTVSYAWDFGFTIASFVVSGVLLVDSLLWQYLVNGQETTAAVPLFPRSFRHNRVLPSGLLYCTHKPSIFCFSAYMLTPSHLASEAFLVGAPITISSIVCSLGGTSLSMRARPLPPASSF